MTIKTRRKKVSQKAEHRSSSLQHRRYRFKLALVPDRVPFLTFKTERIYVQTPRGAIALPGGEEVNVLQVSLTASLGAELSRLPCTGGTRAEEETGVVSPH